MRSPEAHLPLFIVFIRSRKVKCENFVLQMGFILGLGLALVVGLGLYFGSGIFSKDVNVIHLIHIGIPVRT